MTRNDDELIAKALQLDEHDAEAYLAPGVEARVWLLMSVSGSPQHGGNDGYDDNAETYYSWDSTVPNHALVRPGDVAVLWDKERLLGISLVEDVSETRMSKVTYSCPNCGLASLKARKRIEPLYKCFKCGSTFDLPAAISQIVTSYRSRHDAGWVDLYGALSGAELRALCVSPKSQLSIRALRWRAFLQAVRTARPEIQLQPLEARIDRMLGGHGLALTRVRIGQAAFRAAVLARYGPVCALSGAAPVEALEAGHLYQYAEVGKHLDDGGLPLRRDIHRLFDMGLITVNPLDLTVDVSEELRRFKAYGALHGVSVQVRISPRQRRWLTLHWQEHRPTVQVPAA